MSTQFDLPDHPEEFGVALPSADLRRLDFSALEFSTLRRAMLEYVSTYFPDDFNDFVSSNATIMLIELVAYVGAILSQRSDILANESFLPTSFTEEAVINHLALINEQINRAISATVDVEVSIPFSVATEVRIPSGTLFSLPSPDGDSLFYEIFSAPGDFSSPIIIPPGKRGIIAFGIEGRFAEPFVSVSGGGPDQIISIPDTSILDSPITVESEIGDQTISWQRVNILERSKSNDRVYEVKFTETGMNIVFGDDVAGKSPTAGETITVTYRRGGGIRGRIATNTINEVRQITPEAPASAAVEVTFRNVNPSQGGRNKENIDRAKRRAPLEAATHETAVSGEDYAVLASEYSHPVFGAVLKASATVRTNINTNLVELFVLAEGSNGEPVTPSLGLKRGIEQFFENRTGAFTNEIRAQDAFIKPIDFRANVIVSRNVDPALIKTRVINAVNQFFDVSNFDLGKGFNLGPLYQIIQQIEGIQFVTIFNPSDEILEVDKKTTDPDTLEVGYAELITLGDLEISIFFEKNTGAPRV